MNLESIAKNKIVIYEIPPNHLNMFYSNGKARYCGDCGSAFVVVTNPKLAANVCVEMPLLQQHLTLKTKKQD